MRLCSKSVVQTARLNYARRYGFAASLPVRQPRLAGGRVAPAGLGERARDLSEGDAAFAGGIALKSLDDQVRVGPAWAGCWRQRQALRCAQSAVQLIGRNEGEAGLRNAVLLTAPGNEPGPAGAMHLAFKKLAVKTRPIGSKVMEELAALMGLRREGLSKIADLLMARFSPAVRRASPSPTWSPTSAPPAPMPKFWPGASAIGCWRKNLAGIVGSARDRRTIRCSVQDERRPRTGAAGRARLCTRRMRGAGCGYGGGIAEGERHQSARRDIAGGGAETAHEGRQRRHRKAARGGCRAGFRARQQSLPVGRDAAVRTAGEFWCGA